MIILQLHMFVFEEKITNQPGSLSSYRLSTVAVSPSTRPRLGLAVAAAEIDASNVGPSTALSETCGGEPWKVF